MGPRYNILNLLFQDLIFSHVFTVLCRQTCLGDSTLFLKTLFRQTIPLKWKMILMNGAAGGLENIWLKNILYELKYFKLYTECVFTVQIYICTSTYVHKERKRISAIWQRWPLADLGSSLSWILKLFVQLVSWILNLKYICTHGATHVNL